MGDYVIDTEKDDETLLREMLEHCFDKETALDVIDIARHVEPPDRVEVGQTTRRASRRTGLASSVPTAEGHLEHLLGRQTGTGHSARTHHWKRHP